MKKCSKCGDIKALSEFNKRLGTEDRYRNECKLCRKIYNHKIYLSNIEERKAKQREWNAANKDKKKIQCRKWYLENPEKVKKSREKWLEANLGKKKESIKRWAENNQEKRNASSKRWREKHPDKAKEVMRKSNFKIWNSPTGRLSGIISSALRRTLKGAKSRRHWEDIVGYSTEELRIHLANQFTHKMSWENHGSYWEIDHIIPVKAFNFSDIEHIDFKKCWSLQNLQPLPKSENRRKSSKLFLPFQPSLEL